MLPGDTVPRAFKVQRADDALDAAITISKRQEANLPLPFAFDAALGQENQIVDSLSDRSNRSHFEDPWHWLACRDSIECVLRQRRDIVCDDDASLVGRPLQNRGVIRSRQAHV